MCERIRRTADPGECRFKQSMKIVGELTHETGSLSSSVFTS